MMCEHEFVEASATFLTGTVFRRVCRYCTKTPREIDIEQQLAAANAALAELKEYQSFCPECGSKNIFSPINRTEKGHLACKDCGQEFFTTVIYADCIAEKLSKMKSTEQRAEQATENERQHARNFDWKETRR